MDEIAFRIAHRELGIGPQHCVEIAINGQDLCDLLREVEQPITVAGPYAGLEPELVVAPNSRFLDDPRLPPISATLRMNTWTMMADDARSSCDATAATTVVATWS